MYTHFDVFSFVIDNLVLNKKALNLHHLRPSETVVSKPSVMEDVDEEDVFQPNKRFRKNRSLDEDNKVLVTAVPKATGYKSISAAKLFA